ncbi:MAG: hypothetical protein OES32_16100 [Acidobacteriota bacterium]|nr:hypothetical protein [Acidobacteriota bacterium]MDH3525099.1 hypothetical protein [Acidobacteriota bacterium]
MRPTASAILCLASLAALSAPPPGSAETLDYSCAPTAVRVDEQRIEILCAEPIILDERSQDRFRRVDRFSYPMISQSFQPQLGSQVKLLDYYLDVAQNAVLHSRVLHVWFDTDHSLSPLYGCDPENCRALVGLALTHAPAVVPPQAADAAAGLSEATGDQ